MNKTILYQSTRLGKIQKWTIWVEPKGSSGHPEIWTEFGLDDGKKQMTHDIISEGVNVGKSNETNSLEQACLTLERKVTKQKENGYRENIKELNKEGISWDERLPKELCMYKPKNSIDIKKIDKLEKANRAIYSVKRDGMCHIVRVTKEFGVEIYSRRMDLMTDKYTHLVEPLSKLNDGTILLGEIVLLDGDKDNFNGVSQICRSDPEKAIQRQEELGKVSFYIFDVAFCNNENWMTSYGYSERHDQIKSLSKVCNSKYIIPAEIINKSHEEAMKEIKQRGLEGLVIWDADGIMKDKECFTTNGKAYRPNVIWKSKPRYELDGIVRFDPSQGIGEFGSGKNSKKMKSLHLYQLDNEGNEVFISKIGGGYSDEQRTFYTTAKYPRVFEVLYDSIQKGTGSLRFPIFSRDRTLAGDKGIGECMMSDEIKQARRTK